MITPFQTRAAERRAKIAAEIDAAKKTLEDATTVGAGFWVSYIFLMFYIAVSAGAVTHVDLLLENPVKLPFLNLDLPLVGFFFLAPILFIVMHVFTLSKLVMLAEKAKRFLEALEKLPKAEAREKLRRSLPSNIFTQFMAGPSEISGGGFGALLRLMGWITMALAPALLLLFLQIQFLPYHSLWLTWEHRAALATDLALLWWLWRRALNTAMLAPPAPSGLWENAKYLFAVTGRSVALLIGLALSAVAVFASLVATYPTEWETSPLAFAPRLDAHRAALTEAIFGEKSSCARGGDVAQDNTKIAQAEKVFGVDAPFPRWPCNTLHLEEFNIFEALKLKDRNNLEGREFTVRLRERRLEGANLAYAKLGKADLRDAKLTGANLNDAELQGANLNHADMQFAALDRVKMEHAKLEKTSMPYTKINHANLQEALLDDANLTGAKLNYAAMQGAVLSGAESKDASFYNAKLQGAILFAAHLQAAKLIGTNLQGSSLDKAELQGATLNSANLQGATLNHAKLKAATLSNSKLQGVSLYQTNLLSASLDYAELQGATLNSANLQGATLNNSNMSGTDLANALVWRTNFSQTKLTDFYSNSINWHPVGQDGQPWAQQDYQALSHELTEVITTPEARDLALTLIEKLDCDIIPGENDCAKKPDFFETEELQQLRQQSQHTTIESYRAALSKILRSLVCDGNENAIYILRGLMRDDTDLPATSGRLFATRENAPNLIDSILEPRNKSDCPVSVNLTATDKNRLLQIKQATKKSVRLNPPPDKIPARP